MNKTTITILILLFAQILVPQSLKFGKITKEELAETSHAIEKDAPAAVLYRYTYTSFDYSQREGFVLKTDVHERIKIYTKDGYDWATVQIGLYQGSESEETISGLKAYTYNLENGSIEKTKVKSSAVFKEKRNKTLDVEKFTFPNIKDGSIIEYKYTLASPFISTIDTYRFQEEIPVDKVEMKLYAPEYLSYRTHGRGWVPYTIENSKRSKKFTWNYEVKQQASEVGAERGRAEKEITENGYEVVINNVPSLKDEPYSGNIKNYMSGLDFELAFTKFPNRAVEYYSSTWEDVVNRIYKSDNFGKEIEENRYFKKELDPIIQEYNIPAERAVAIFNFVKNRMNWNDYYGVYADLGVKKAFDSQVGSVADINLMLTGMLKYAGLSANPVLISTKSNGVPLYPTRTGFNYVISAVRIDDRVMLLDAADKDGVPNILKTNLLNWFGYIVKEDGSSRTINLFPKKPATHDCMLSIDVHDDFTVTGDSKNRFTGHYARQQRKEVGNLSEEKQLEFLQKQYDGLDLSEAIFKNVSDVSKPLSNSYSYEFDGGIEVIGDKVYVDPLQHLKIDENYFKADTRSYPIDFIYPWQDRFTVSVKIPEGYTVDFVPESTVVNLRDGLGSYKYQASPLGDKIQITVQRSIHNAMIGPDMYLDLKSFFQHIVDKEQEKIVLVKQ